MSNVIKCGCGGSLRLGDENCPKCTWPFQLSGWKKTKIRVKRVTIDTCCLNVKKKIHALNVLKSWEKQGHIEIQRSDALLKELRGQERIEKAQQIPGHPALTTFPIALGGGAVLAGADLGEELKQVLFPTTKDLTDKQRMDVRHLQQHVRTGAHTFVTINTRDFIDGGKAEELCSKFGVWVFTPDDIVTLLRELYGLNSRKPRPPEPEAVPFDVMRDELISGRLAASVPKIDFSRKTGRVTIRDEVAGIPCTFAVLLKDIDEALNRISNLPSSNTSDLTMRLFDALLEAHHSFTGRKPRGVQAKRSKPLLEKIKYASTWTHFFVEWQWQTQEDRHPIIQDATRALERRVKQWPKYDRSDQIVLVTAFLVTGAYKKDWQTLKLADPFRNINPEFFYRTYIQPKYDKISAITKKSPRLLAFPSNPYLRRIWHHFLR